MALDESAFFNKNPETRPGQFQCPRCRRTGDYRIRWMRHSRKKTVPGRADAADRAKFDKLRDFLLRLDDDVTCKTCGKRFDIPSQQSLMFLDQLGGLPNDDELQEEINAAADEPEPEPEPERVRKPALPDRFTRKPSGWK
jgi:hypothetical protein